MTLRRDPRRERDQLPRLRRAACARRLERLRARAQRLARRGVRTAEITEPGFRHDVFSAWHPLWVGGAAHAPARRRSRRARPRVPEHRAADGSVLPDGEAAFLLRTRGGEQRGARPPRRRRRRRLAGHARRVLPGRRPRVRAARNGALVGRRRARSARRRRGASVGAASPSSPATSSSRAATGCERRSPPRRPRGCLRPWVLHTGLGPDDAASRLHGAGDRRRDPGGRHAGPARRQREARRGARRR